MVRPRKSNILSPNTPTFSPALHPQSAAPARPPDQNHFHGADVASSSGPASGAVTPVARQDAANEQRSGKRKCVSTACIPCRKRKSKCDGGLPLCSTCTAVYKTECSYDADVDTRRKAAKREDGSDASGTDAARQVLQHLRACPDSDIQELLSHIRNEDNDTAILEGLRIRGSRQKTSPNGNEGSFDRHHESSFIVAGETRWYGDTSQLSRLPAEDTMPSHNMRTPSDSTFSRTEGWTKVTKDINLVRHLIRLYFTWQHPFYYVLDEEAFWQDFELGESEYCSSLLVNAICAYGCHNSDLPQARADPTNSKTAGDHFFAEARRLLNEHENSRLPTVQALQIMSMREASSDRDSSGFFLAGRSLRMAIEMGLHRSSHDGQLSETELKSRRLTFWGLFTCETAWSVAMGRIAGISDSAVDARKLPVDKTERDWVSYTDDDYLGKTTPSAPRRFNFSEFHKALWAFSELVNSAVCMYFAGRSRPLPYTILQKKEAYEKWYKELPDCLQIKENSPPQVYDLHLYYNICMYHLFSLYQPYTFTWKQTEVRPREVCAKHMQEILRIMRTYRLQFPLRRVNLLLTHVLLNVCLFLGTSLPPQNATEPTRDNDEASRDLVDILRDLSIMAPCMQFAVRCFTIAFKMSCEWNKQIPAAAYELMQLSPSLSTDTRLMRSIQSPAALPSPAQPYHQGPAQNSSHHDPDVINGSRQFTSANDPQVMASANYATNHTGTGFHSHLNLPSRPLSRLNGSEAMQNPSVHAHTSLDHGYGHTYVPTTHAGSAHNSNIPMFFAPIPGQGVPLMNYTSSPMDVYNVMEGNIHDRMKSDGFNLIQPMYGAVPGMDHQYSQHQHTTNGHGGHGHERGGYAQDHGGHHSSYPMPDQHHQQQQTVVSPTHSNFAYGAEAQPDSKPWWAGQRQGQPSRPLQ